MGETTSKAAVMLLVLGPLVAALLVHPCLARHALAGAHEKHQAGGCGEGADEQAAQGTDPESQFAHHGSFPFCLRALDFDRIVAGTADDEAGTGELAAV